MDDIKRCLDFFGLDKNVSENELKAVRNLYLKTYHPDSGRPDNDEMAKMTNIAYERISLYLRDRDSSIPVAARAGTPGPSSRPEDAFYEKKAREYLHNRSRQARQQAEPIPARSGRDLWRRPGSGLQEIFRRRRPQLHLQPIGHR